MNKKTTATTDTMRVPAPNIQLMRVDISGTAPLIFHKWSEKAKRQIREKQAKKATAGREVRKPTAEYLESFYYNTKGNVAFPANSLKQALVGAARNIEGITMAELRGAVFVMGDTEDGMLEVLVKGKPFKPQEPKMYDDDEARPESILGYDPKAENEVQMREDMVRVGMGSADLRYRGQVKEWSMKVLVRFNANKLSAEQVVNLLQYAGFSSGLGEWRPERNGDFGTFEVTSTNTAGGK